MESRINKVLGVLALVNSVNLGLFVVMCIREPRLFSYIFLLAGLVINTIISIYLTKLFKKQGE